MHISPEEIYGKAEDIYLTTAAPTPEADLVIDQPAFHHAAADNIYHDLIHKVLL